MGLFDKIAKIISGKNENDTDNIEKSFENTEIDKDIILADSCHIAEYEEYADEDKKYRISFNLNDSFKEAKSHSAEVMMLSTYAPDDKYGEEGNFPYVAVQLDDDVYNAVEEFKENGSFTGAIEITPLKGKFYFKAKMDYYDDIMYFYGIDRCDGFWENNALCIVYPKAYMGTENEARLMNVLDEAAESYNEERIV